MRESISRHYRCAFLAISIIASAGCAGSEAPVDPATCADALVRSGQLRLEDRHPKMSHENAQRHAKQIAAAANDPQLSTCEQLSDAKKKDLAACMSAAETNSQGRRCLAAADLNPSRLQGNP